MMMMMAKQRLVRRMRVTYGYHENDDDVDDDNGWLPFVVVS